MGFYSPPRLYSCLANGSADEFQRGDQLFRMRAVKDPLQIGKSPIMPCGSLLLPSQIMEKPEQIVCVNNYRARVKGRDPGLGSSP